MFFIRLSHGAKVLKEIVGEGYRQVFTSDRAKAYTSIRQYIVIERRIVIIDDFRIKLGSAARAKELLYKEKATVFSPRSSISY